MPIGGNVKPQPTAVQLSAVSAGYGPHLVLDEVHTALPAGRTTALVGANGSGKSTLLAVVAGVHDPASGTVHRHHRHRPALVLQRSAVPDALPVTVRDTVAMGRWAHRGPWRRLTAHDRAVVDACLRRLGIARLAGRRLDELSGGQRQRALLAQGLAQESDLLLLDEPATGLDAAAQEAILDLIDEVRAEGTTVVHATHDPHAARRADHCLVLTAGRITAEGAPAEALEAVGRPHP
ncbi:zinc ABC transporter ATP-binding protein AztA [Nocardiopsis composta]